MSEIIEEVQQRQDATGRWHTLRLRWDPTADRCTICGHEWGEAPADVPQDLTGLGQWTVQRSCPGGCDTVSAPYNMTITPAEGGAQ